MSSTSFSGSKYDENHGPGYPGGASRHVNGVQEAGSGMYSDDRSYHDDDSHQNNGCCLVTAPCPHHSPYREDLRHHDDYPCRSHSGRPLQQYRQTSLLRVHELPRTTPRTRRHGKRPVPTRDNYSSCDDEDESTKAKELTRKKKAELVQKIADEERFNALVEERYQKRVAEEKQREADEKEREEQRLKDKKEADDLHAAEIKKALANQLEATRKEIEEKENALKEKSKREAQAKIEEREKFEKALALAREAEKKATADKKRAIEDKAEADRAEAERLEAEVERRAQQKYTERVEQEAQQKEAEIKKAEKEAEDKEFENQEAAKIDKLPPELEEKLKNFFAAVTEIAFEPGKHDTRDKSTSSEVMGTPDESNRLARIKKLLRDQSKCLDFGLEALFPEEVAPEGEAEATPPDVGVLENTPLDAETSGSLKGSHESVGQSEKARTPKHGNGDRKSTRKAKGEEGHGEKKDKAKRKEKKTTLSRKRARSVLGWFAGESYFCQKLSKRT